MDSSGPPTASSRAADPLQDEPPGRSPQRRTAAREELSRGSSTTGSDPLAEGLSLLAGVTIGLLTLVVPLLSVITDRGPGSGFSAQPVSGSALRR